MNMKPYPGSPPPNLSRVKWVRLLIEEHPFEFSLSTTLLLFGSRAIMTRFESVPGSVQMLPSVFVYLYCLLACIGGLSVILGLIARWRYVWAYGLETFGLFISGSAWGSYVVGLMFTRLNHQSTLVILAMLSLAVACIIRAFYLNHRSQSVLEALRLLHDTRESGDEQ